MPASPRALRRRARRLHGSARVRPRQRPAEEDAFAAFRGLADASATPTSKRRWTAALRALAGDAFVGDRGQRTVSWWAERLEGIVSRKTVEKWSAADGWLARRDELHAAVRQELFTTMASKAVRAFIDDLDALDRLHATLTAQLEGRENALTVPVLTKAGELLIDEVTGEPRTKSVEVAPAAFNTRIEAVRALLALDQRRDEKRRFLLGTDEPAAAAPVPAAPLTLSPAVARAMARAKLLAERTEAEEAGTADGCSGGE